MWNCPHCHKQIETSFDVCWNCGTDCQGVQDAAFQAVADQDAKREEGRAASEEESTRAALPENLPAADAEEAFYWPRLAVRDECQGKPGQLVTLASSFYPVQAWMAKNLLESEGISAYLVGEHFIGAYWLMAHAANGMKIQVAFEDFVRAREELLEDRSEVFSEIHVDSPGPRCPRCGATELCHEKYSRRVMFFCWIFLSFPPPIPGRKPRCLGCGWPQARSVQYPLPSIPSQFTIRHWMIFTLILSVLLGLAKMVGMNLGVMSPLPPPGP